MKLKKKIKILLTVIFLILVFILGFLVYKTMRGQNNTPIPDAKIIASIGDYGYSLKENKNETYKSLFHELEEILENEKVDYTEYAKKISEMFIYDFFSLEDKTTKNDIGGIDFIHPDILSNFLENAEDTYYKYVESNLYGNRKQELPAVDVDSIQIKEVEKTNYAIGETEVEEAYQVQIEWNYTSSAFSTYQKSATIILVKVGNRLYMVELSK